MPKLSELLQTAHDPNPAPDDAIPTLKDEGGEATNKMVYLEDLPVSTPTQTALNGKVNKAGDTMTGRLSNTNAVLAYSHSRNSTNLTFGNLGKKEFAFFNETDGNIQTFGIRGDASGIHLGANTAPRILTGTGFPNGVVSAPTGSIYIDTNVTNGASSWIKKSGTGNTGWQVLEGDTGWMTIPSLMNSFWKSGILQIRRVNNKVLFRIAELRVGASPTGARTTPRIILTAGAFPNGFKYATSWGTAVPIIAPISVANRIGRVATMSSFDDLAVSIMPSETNAGNWTEDDIVGGIFEYDTPQQWPITLP